MTYTICKSLHTSYMIIKIKKLLNLLTFWQIRILLVYNIGRMKVLGYGSYWIIQYGSINDGAVIYLTSV